MCINFAIVDHIIFLTTEAESLEEESHIDWLDPLISRQTAATHDGLRRRWTSVITNRAVAKKEKLYLCCSDDIFRGSDWWSKIYGPNGKVCPQERELLMSTGIVLQASFALSSNRKLRWFAARHQSMNYAQVRLLSDSITDVKQREECTGLAR